MEYSDDMVTFEDAAKLAGVTRGTIYRWNQDGRIHAFKFHGVWLTSPDELRRALNDAHPMPIRARIGTPAPELLGS